MDVAPPAMQLSYDQETIEAGLIDNSNLQPLVLPPDHHHRFFACPPEVVVVGC